MTLAELQRRVAEVAELHKGVFTLQTDHSTFHDASVDLPWPVIAAMVEVIAATESYPLAAQLVSAPLANLRRLLESTP